MKRKKFSWYLGEFVIYAFLLSIFIITFVPFWNIAVLSFNEAGDTQTGGFILWPRVFTASSYAAVFSDAEILVQWG